MKMNHGKAWRRGSFFFALLIVTAAISLSICRRLLLKRNIEFRVDFIVFQMVITWFFLPMSLIFCYLITINTNIKERKTKFAVSLSGGIVIILILFCFLIRSFYFILFQYKIETPLEDGRIFVEYQNFGPEPADYYQPINRFLYIRLNQ